jgi:cell division transport system permease protein
MGLRYAFAAAFRSMLHDKWINILSIFTVAAGLLFTSITLLAVYNIDALTKKLPEKFSIMLYLRDNLSREQINSLMEAANSTGKIERTVYIPKDEALRELKTTLKDTDYILDGLEENPLPDVIEIKLKSTSVSPESVKTLTSELKALKGIQDIEYGEKFLSAIYSIKTGFKSIGIISVVLMTAGMFFVCYTTVKILFYRKKPEIETYKLLGATRTFIRAPFILEGATIGLTGGLISASVMFLLYSLVFFQLRIAIPLFNAVIFPINLVFLLPLAGLLFGIIGAFIAIGRIRF